MAPAILNESGEELEGEAEGYLVRLFGGVSGGDLWGEGERGRGSTKGTYNLIYAGSCLGGCSMGLSSAKDPQKESWIFCLHSAFWPMRCLTLTLKDLFRACLKILDGIILGLEDLKRGDSSFDQHCRKKEALDHDENHVGS